MQLKPTLFAIAISCLLFSFRAIQAQEHTAVSLNIKDASLTQVFSLIEKQTEYKFAYSSDLMVDQKKVTINVNNIPLHKLLIYLFRDRRIDYSIIGNQIVLKKAPDPVKITISGYVKDSTSAEALANTSIYLPLLKQSTTTNNYGFYSITINESERLAIVVVNSGHKRQQVLISGNKSAMVNFYLQDILSPMRPLSIKTDSLNAAFLSLPLNIANATNKVTEDSLILTNEDTTWINEDLLQSVASVSGNGDIINSIQMMPGVIAGMDATNGYYVRGGNKDQNLIQLDEATLYNPSHFFGLVSAFNSSAINNATLIKDGFPATYGDNLSSVLDITMKEGNNQQIGGEVQAGSTTSGFTLYGPIVKQKSSYLFSVRRSTMDLWLEPLLKDNSYNNFHFYDINAKVNYRISENDHLFLSFYKGRDNSSYTSDSLRKAPIGYGISYGNQTFTLRWNHLYNPQLFANTSVIYNNYSQSITAQQKPFFAELYSGIRDIECKSDLNYYPNPTHKITAGISLLYQTLTPASLSNSELTGPTQRVNPSALPEQSTYRAALYLGDEIKMGTKLLLYIGGRLPLLYTKNANYTHFEPRLSALYNITSSSGIKLSYTHMHQYLHLVQSYNASFPAEIWIGSSSVVKPESSRQSTVGLFKNLKNNIFQISLDGFYKQMDNQLLFGGGEQPPITSNIQNMLVFGKGNSSGIELSLRKMKGKLKGWLAYTYSSATQQFDSLNLGKSFPFANDRQHSLYVTASYTFNMHWELSSNLVITSGRSFTFDSETTITPGGGPGLYKKKEPKGKKTKTEIVQNNYMLNPYNRLDISISYKNKKQLATRTLESEWILSIYNVYARPNTFFAYRTFDPATLKPVVQQVSFLSVIPSITYRLSF
ncbi:MAG TPA: TonB-dependent receptor [Bacteroidales bacterium]|nr:TonB-dependent receptor [Bacteroidales bacterium]